MKYAGMIKNDIAAGDGVNVSFFVQGCPIRCFGCHNPETWDFEGGKEFTPEVLEDLIQSIKANGIQRNFSLLGGEPLCKQNFFLSYLLLSTVKEKFPTIKTFVWTGYTVEELQKQYSKEQLKKILSVVDMVIAGPFICGERDITLAKRGSRNQRIYKIENESFIDITEKI